MTLDELEQQIKDIKEQHPLAGRCEITTSYMRKDQLISKYLYSVEFQQNYPDEINLDFERYH